jgi:putative SOS response-associated peptidase YedK
MCARIFLDVTDENLAAFLDLLEAAPPPFAPRYNIAPGQDVLAARTDPSGRRAAALLRWGLVPERAQASPRAPLVNVRSESADRGLFRDAFRTRRCVVPAAGFYEWRKMGRLRQPFAVRAQPGLVGLAAIWSPGTAPDGRLRPTFAVLTTEANERVASIHDRMPVILERDQIGEWLHPDLHERADFERLLQPYPADLTTVAPVSTRVNKSDFDDPSCLDSPETERPRQKSFF